MDQFIDYISNKLLTYEGFSEPLMDKNGNTDKKRMVVHVYTWLKQFDPDEQENLVRITANLLQKAYIEKNYEQQFIEKQFENELIRRGNLIATPLTIQRNGESQKTMVGFYNKLVEEKGLEYDTQNYLYLDDFMFSGGRVFNDLSNYIPLIKRNITIIVLVIGWHTSGQYYQANALGKKIEKHNKENNLNIELKWLSIENLRLENRLIYNNRSDVLWPMEQTLDLPELMTRKIPGFKYRTGFIESKIFDNHNDRIFLEKICLKYGFKIIDRCTNVHKTTRPLGNSKFDYGFGGLIFNYRNCPNNTPLIFWWGSNDPHHFMSRQWYPLMPRRVY
ncbi:hypothetical protein [Acinetobacter sp. YH12041]|uniref:phosphoribosyltransferase-like protein n=1 Tax=Acinetobacter sp. YH12041 TaxID=2601049 RepID=UPI001C5562B8|nr:hypothetical protein [Acinetobacter sp. YH12041]